MHELKKMKDTNPNERIDIDEDFFSSESSLFDVPLFPVGKSTFSSGDEVDKENARVRLALSQTILFETMSVSYVSQFTLDA